MDDAKLETIKRHSDDPKLEIGETVVLKDGLTGIVLARYTPSAHKDEVRYIVQVQSRQHGTRRH